MKGKESYSRTIRKPVLRKTNKEKILSFYGRGGIDKEKIRGLGHLWKKWSYEYA